VGHRSVLASEGHFLVWTEAGLLFTVLVPRPGVFWSTSNPNLKQLVRHQRRKAIAIWKPKLDMQAVGTKSSTRAMRSSASFRRQSPARNVRRIIGAFASLSQHWDWSVNQFAQIFHYQMRAMAPKLIGIPFACDANHEPELPVKPGFHPRERILDDNRSRRVDDE
jgi:hypothetical protein